jgi:hypothetical protein
MGFLGSRYAAARHIVPDHDTDAPPHCTIRMQSKESDEESEEEGFLGARYAAARHIVPE